MDTVELQWGPYEYYNMGVRTGQGYGQDKKIFSDIPSRLSSINTVKLTKSTTSYNYLR